MEKFSKYFLLYHGIKDEIKPSNYNINIDDETLFLEVSSLILSIKRINFEKINSFNSFNNLISKINIDKIDNLDEVYSIQQSILSLLKHVDYSKYIDVFQYLLNNNIILKNDFEKLNSIFEITEDVPELDSIKRETVEEKRDYKTIKNNLYICIEELKHIFEEETKLDEIDNYLNNQKFSIAVTGVMNAGKSSLLNTLISKNILGTSTIPQTASLCVLKYSEKESARVHFWNTREYSKIDTNKIKIKNIDNFIKDKSKHLDISLDDLSIYSTAQNDLSTLVKEVEVFTPLEYLKNSIEIVDTPGLDDIIELREQLTKDYVKNSDMIIHLMNVTQSATQKDIDFIIDTLLLSNISKMLILITRVDTLTKKDVQDVINYTKQSITLRLKELNENSKVSSVLESLEFLAVSSKLASDYKVDGTNKDSYIKSGFFEFEEYLQNTLFKSDSAKAKLILKKAKSMLKDEIDAELKNTTLKISLLNTNKEELDKEIKKFNIYKDKTDKNILDIKQQIKLYKDEFKTYISDQNNNIEVSFYDLQNVLVTRVIDEISYVLNKANANLEKQRLNDLVLKTLRHGLIDILRDYNYLLNKKSIKILNVFNHLFNSINLTHENENGMIIDQNIFSSFSYLDLNNKIYSFAKKQKTKDIKNNTQILQQIVKDELEYILQEIYIKVDTISQSHTDNFFNSISSTLKRLEDSISFQHNELEVFKNNFSEIQKDKESKSHTLNNKIKNINIISSRLDI